MDQLVAWALIVGSAGSAISTLALMSLCAYIVHKTGKTTGLRDLAILITAWRKPNKNGNTQPTGQLDRPAHSTPGQTPTPLPAPEPTTQCTNGQAG
jgi:hypothetical protein